MPHAHEPAPAAPIALSERLQQVTEALAAARTPEQVFDLILRPAVQMVGAAGGAVLLLNDTAGQLERRAQEGHEGDEPTYWQAGPLEGNALISDALRRQQALYFEELSAFLTDYPQLSSAQVQVLIKATAVLPMQLDGEPLGVIVLDFDEPHAFAAEERHFLQTLAAQCAIALGRATLTQGLEQRVQRRTAALEAFAALTEAVGSETDLRVLALRAVEVLQSFLPELSVVYNALEDGLWKARVLSDNIAPDLAAAGRAGHPADAPFLSRAVQAGTGSFMDGSEVVEAGLSYGALAFYPYFRAGQPSSMLVVGRQQTQPWTDAERTIIRGVGRSLGLALERAAQTEELQTRNAALDAYARFTGQVATATDLKTLVAAADSVIWEALGDSLCAYYLVQGDRAMPEVYSLGVRPDLQTRLEAGVPLSLPVVQEAFVRRATAFAEGAAGQVQAGTVGGSSVKTLSVTPYFRDARPYAMFSTGSERPSWTGREKAIIRSVGQGLGSALERLEQVQRLDFDRQTLATFVAFTESAATIAELETLTRRAFTTLQALFPGCTAALYEEHGGLWKARFDTDDMAPELLALIRAGLPATASVFPQLLQTRQTVFVDHWSEEEQAFAHTGDYQTAALYPIVQAGEIHSALGLASRHQASWSVQDQAIINAVGRSFSLLYDRITAAELLEQRRVEAESRTQALEAFAQLTRDLGVQGDRYALIGRAQEVVLSLLSEGFSAYYEPDAGHTTWRLMAQQGETRNPVLQAVMNAGFDWEQTQSLLLPWTTGAPLYQDAYETTRDGLEPGLVDRVGASATLPLTVDGQVLGVFVLVQYQGRSWTGTDRAVLEGVMLSLSLALERLDNIRRLAERSGQLERSNSGLLAANDELEAFSASVSHDLRAPVRHVKGFSELAQEALDQGATGAARDYLVKVGQSADRMSVLIDALLDLARTSQQTLRPGSVDLNALVQRARDDSALELVGRTVVWNIAPMPLVTGDRATLQQVFNNLIANAVKYSRTREQAVIDVWAEETAQEWSISVRDNGVGFNPAYKARLFGVFQRLHAERDFEGTGVGLATVRRIILRHGGRVSADSMIGEGATFGFTLPKSS